MTSAAATPRNTFLLPPCGLDSAFAPPNVKVGADPTTPLDAASTGFSTRASAGRSKGCSTTFGSCGSRAGAAALAAPLVDCGLTLVAFVAGGAGSAAFSTFRLGAAGLALAAFVPGVAVGPVAEKESGAACSVLFSSKSLPGATGGAVLAAAAGQACVVAGLETGMSRETGFVTGLAGAIGAEGATGFATDAGLGAGFAGAGAGVCAVGAEAAGFAGSLLRSRPRATRNVPLACSILMGLVRTRLAPIRKAFATPA